MQWSDRHVKHIPLPPTEAELVEFSEFQARFYALVEEGEKRGWIDSAGDGWWPTGPQPSGHDHRPETDEEYAKRLANPMQKVMWEMNQRILESLRRDSSVFERLRQVSTLKSGDVVSFPVHTRRD